MFRRLEKYKAIVKILAVLIALSGTSMLSSCVYFTNYESKGLEFTALDANTNKPIEGVIAVAIWMLHRSGLESSQYVGIAKLIEVESDEKGRISIPPWGPITTMRGYIPGYEPWIYFYKPGYRLLHRVDGEFYYFSKGNLSYITSRDLQFKMIPVIDQDELVKSITILSSSLDVVTDFPKDCQWPNTKRLIAVLVEQRRDFRRKGIPWPTSYLERLSWYGGNFKNALGRCGYPSDYISELEGIHDQTIDSQKHAEQAGEESNYHSRHVKPGNVEIIAPEMTTVPLPAR